MDLKFKSAAQAIFFQFPLGKTLVKDSDVGSGKIQGTVQMFIFWISK